MERIPGRDASGASVGGRSVVSYVDQAQAIPLEIEASVSQGIADGLIAGEAELEGLELTDEWKQRLMATHKRLADRRRRKVKGGKKSNEQVRIAKMELELQMGYEKALARLEEQNAEATSPTE